MDFEALLDQIQLVLERRGRLTHRGLKRLFELDDELFEDIKEELIHGARSVVEEGGRVLVWIGSGAPVPAKPPVPSEPQQLAPTTGLEHHELTLMSCALVSTATNSSPLATKHLRAVQKRYQTICMTTIKHHGGYVVRDSGDVVLACFGYPQGRDDAATRAAFAGLSLVAELARAQDSSASDTRVDVRIGMHSGELVITEFDEAEVRQQLALDGLASLAARVQELAPPGDILVTKATRELIHSTALVVEPLPSHSPESLDEGLELFRVVEEQIDEQPSASWISADMVGRQRELNTALGQWRLACSGIAQVTLLSGEPGIGKSRFVRALGVRAITTSGGKLITVKCSVHRTNSAFFSVIMCLRRVLNLDAFDTEAAKLARIERMLVQLGFDTTLSVPLLATVLGVSSTGRYPAPSLSPQRQRVETCQLLVECLLRQSRHQPTLLVWEDVHWADPSSLEILDELIARASTEPILNLLTFRPTYRPTWSMRSHMRFIVLGRLPPKHIRALVRQHFRGREPPPKLLESIVARTDGVPLFVEEISKLLAESLAGRADTEDASDPSQILVPMSLRDSIMARLGRLSNARPIAQLGAVIGREFSYTLIRDAFVGSDDFLRNGLARLVDAELLIQSGIPPTSSYLFKHMLVLEVVYQSIAQTTRSAHHATIAKVLQRSADLEAPAELIAPHLSAANLPIQAIPRWLEAGQVAEARSAHREAVAYFSQGLAELEKVEPGPERDAWELSLQLGYGKGLTAIRGYGAPEVRATYARARALCIHAHEQHKLFAVLHGLWRSSLLRAEYRSGCEIAEQLLQLAADQDELKFEISSYRSFAASLFYMGEHERSMMHARKALALAEHDDAENPKSDSLEYAVVDPIIALRAYVAWNLCMTGEIELGRAQMHEAIERAERLEHSFSSALVSSFAAWLYQYIDDVDASERSAEQALEIAKFGELKMWIGWNKVLLGWAKTMRGAPEEGVQWITDGIARWRATGSDLGMSYFLTILAQTQIALDHTDDALRSLDEADAFAARTEERWWQPEAARVRAQLLARLGREQEAREALAAGHALAQQQGARLLLQRIESTALS